MTDFLSHLTELLGFPPYWPGALGLLWATYAALVWRGAT